MGIRLVNDFRSRGEGSRLASVSRVTTILVATDRQLWATKTGLDEEDGFM